jgi:hypothetical protein
MPAGIVLPLPPHSDDEVGDCVRGPVQLPSGYAMYVTGVSVFRDLVD